VIQAKVINVSKEDKKIGLSIKKLEESEEKDIYKTYLNTNNGATSNLGELLKAGMLNLEAKVAAEEQAPEERAPEEDPDTSLADQVEERAPADETSPEEDLKKEKEDPAAEDPAVAEDTTATENTTTADDTAVEESTDDDPSSISLPEIKDEG
jgi:hypothetical protein